MHYLQPDFLRNISKAKLIEFELNFKRMMCSWCPDDNGLLATYAMSCLTYDKHIFEARHLDYFYIQIHIHINNKAHGKKIVIQFVPRYPPFFLTLLHYLYNSY